MSLDKKATVLLRKEIEMSKLLNIYLSHFPRHEKYALCSQIRNNAYRMYALTVEGYKRYHKKTTLQNLDISHEELRMQLYLSEQLGYFSWRNAEKQDHDKQDRFKKISMLCDEIGAMIGEWIKVSSGGSDHG